MCFYIELEVELNMWIHMHTYNILSLQLNEFLTAKKLVFSVR